MDYNEYARQMRVNAVKDANGNIICSPELWEQIARIIENIDTLNFNIHIPTERGGARNESN